MQPIKRSYTGAGSYVIPLSTYADAGASFFATSSVTVTALVDKDDTATVLPNATGVIATVTGTAGVITVPADALLVVAGGAVDITVLQYGT